MCSLRIQEESEWEKHVVECGRKRRQKRFECSHCEYATNKKSDMDRHCRTRHGGYAKADSESEEDWEQLDLGTLSDVVGETASATSPEVTQRKPTRPDPVHTPKSKLLNKRSMMPVGCTNSIQASHDNFERDCSIGDRFYWYTGSQRAGFPSFQWSRKRYSDSSL